MHVWIGARKVKSGNISECWGSDSSLRSWCFVPQLQHHLSAEVRTSTARSFCFFAFFDLHKHQALGVLGLAA